MKVKISESEIRGMIQESVKRILNEWQRSGYVSPDGNGMTGGHWGSSKTSKTIDFDPFEYIQKIEMPKECLDIVSNNLKETYKADLELDLTYDESTGYGSQYSPVVSVDDMQIEGSFYDDVKNLPIEDSLKQEIIDYVEGGVAEYEDFEPDYDEGPDPDAMRDY